MTKNDINKKKPEQDNIHIRKVDPPKPWPDPPPRKNPPKEPPKDKPPEKNPKK